MRICFTVYDIPDLPGGPMVNARRLLPELVRRGHRVSALVMYHGTSSPMSAQLRDQGIECRTVDRHEYTEDAVRWTLRQVRDLSPDVFVANLSVPALFASRWIRRAGVPTVAALRSDDAFYWDLVDQFVAGGEEWAASGLVSVSAGLLEIVKEKGPAHTRFDVIPSGVPVPPDAACLDGPIRMVYVGLLNTYRKRIMEVAAAMGRVLGTDPEATASFYGDGFQKADLEGFVSQQGYGPRMTVEGQVPCEDIQDRLRRYNVIVLLSEAEGTPGAVMDGMACGLVPVCLDIRGGVRELVIDGKTGILVKDREDSFFSAIGRLRRDPELRRRLGQAAREHILNGFSLEIAANRWEDFLGQLADGCTDQRRRIHQPLSLGLPGTRPGLRSDDERKPSAVRRLFWHACACRRWVIDRSRDKRSGD